MSPGSTEGREAKLQQMHIINLFWLPVHSFCTRVKRTEIRINISASDNQFGLR